MDAKMFDEWLDKIAAGEEIPPGGIDTVDMSSIAGKQSDDAALLPQPEEGSTSVGDRAPIETLSSSGEQVNRQVTEEYKDNAFEHDDDSEAQLERLFAAPVGQTTKRASKQLSEDEFFRALRDMD